MFKLALAINLLLMYVAPPFEQTLITHNQGLFVRDRIFPCPIVRDE